MAEGDDDTIEGSVPTPASTDEEVPELVAGRYKILRWIGGGGMGRVYEALDTELHEKVALKVLRAGMSEEALERFRREVKLTRRIQHPNVARMFDIGDHETQKFLTMELIDGESLTRETRSVMPVARVIDVGRQIAEGLAAAHAKSVIHRDLKPDNVLIERRTGRAVLTDFGIARGTDDPSVTQVGSIVGTPRYMAPEQLAGQEADARSDVFALGVILYEAIAGQRPWRGDNAIAVAVSQATQIPMPLPPTTPRELADAIAHCLELESERRPTSARELAERFASMSAPVTQTRLVRPSRPPRTMQTPSTSSPSSPSSPFSVPSSSFSPTPSSPPSLPLRRHRRRRHRLRRRPGGATRRRRWRCCRWRAPRATSISRTRCSRI